MVGSDFLTELLELDKIIDTKSRRQKLVLDKTCDADSKHNKDMNWMSLYSLRQSSQRDRYVELTLPESTVPHTAPDIPLKRYTDSSRSLNKDDSYLLAFQKEVDCLYTVGVGGNIITEVFLIQLLSRASNS